MNKIRCFLILTLCNCTLLISQTNKKQYFNKVIYGTSLTVITDSYMFSNNSNSEGSIKEYAWNNNLAIDITPHWRVGMQYISIKESSKDFVPNKYFMAGSFIQYSYLIKDVNPHRLYFETSLNIGNRCSCDNFQPYKQNNLKYLGLGGGGSIKITNWLQLELAFFTYKLLNNVNGVYKYNWTQYIIGLDFPIYTKK